MEQILEINEKDLENIHFCAWKLKFLAHPEEVEIGNYKECQFCKGYQLDPDKDNVPCKTYVPQGAL